MGDLIEILESFNRKERFFLIAHALGLQSDSGEPAFSLSDSFRKDLSIPADACRIFVAMDYHLDWLQAALRLYRDPGKTEFSNKGKVIEGTQEDVDLLVAYEASGQFHLILVEAKAYSGWTNKQLLSKAKRLRKIFGEDGKEWDNVQPHFYAIGPKESKGLRPKCLPKWMLSDHGKLQWLPCLRLPKRLKVVRCGKAYEHFRVEIDKV